MSNQEIIAKAISKLSDEEKAAIYPPVFRKNFVVRKGWMGRNQVITFDTKPTKTKPASNVQPRRGAGSDAAETQPDAMLVEARVLVTKYGHAEHSKASGQA